VLHHSIKAKGRRFQVEVAETIARARGLTIEAVPPTKTGVRKDVRWVEEGHADLRVRRMGEAGADVALLSELAREQITLGHNIPVWIECKNAEGWTFDAGFWRTGKHYFIAEGLIQAKKAMPTINWKPVLIMSKNRWPALAIWEATGRELSQLESRAILHFAQYSVAHLDDFVKLLGRVL